MAGQGGKRAELPSEDNNIEERLRIETEVVEDTDSTFAINMTRCRFATSIAGAPQRKWVLPSRQQRAWRGARSKTTVKDAQAGMAGNPTML